MDTVINATRSLGKIIQSDDRYIRYQLAQQRNDEDMELQQKIAEFTEIRGRLNGEMQKAEKSQERIDELNKAMRELYGEIFENPNMQELSAARSEMESLLGFINQIVTGSSNGQNPDTIEYQESCGGSCSGCAGCD